MKGDFISTYFLLMKHLFLVVFTLGFVQIGFSQDTLKVSLPELEKRFLNNNLILLVTKSNVDISKAYTEQAKLWDNPNVMFETGFINLKEKKVFDRQEAYIQIQQLFRLAHKREKLTAFSQANEKLNEAQFNDLMRILRHQLRSDYYDLVNIEQKRAWYAEQIAGFSQLINAVSDQVKAGNMAQKDLVRLQSQSWSLQRDLLDLEQSRIPIWADMQVLLGEKTMLTFLPQSTPLSINAENTTLTDLMTTAQQNRSDLKVVDANVALLQANVVYQKALAKPDLTAALTYDRVNTYTPNYIGVQVGIPIPVFNKNQGNIKAAELQVKQQGLQRDAVSAQIVADIVSAYRRLQELENWQRTKASDFYKNYETFYKQVADSYQKRQITLVEFIDFFQDYQQQKLQQLEHQSRIRKSAEEVNYAVGKDVF